MMEKNHLMLAKTFFGFEDILATELKNLGAAKIEKGIRSVSFEGDKGFMYKANLCLRTALKILKPITKFFIRNEKDYYQKLYDFQWEKYFSVNQTFDQHDENSRSRIMSKCRKQLFSALFACCLSEKYWETRVAVFWCNSRATAYM